MIFIGITIIDAPCGAGKTEYAIRYMSGHQERPFLYIAPRRRMFDRIRGIGEYEGKGVNRCFFTPDANGLDRRKLTSLKEMISVGVDIVSTHDALLWSVIKRHKMA